MRSNYETGRPTHPADLRATVLHMAVSMFEDAEGLSPLARRRPDRVGTHVARVLLRPDRGICLADTGSPGHWSIWGFRDELATWRRRRDPRAQLKGIRRLRRYDLSYDLFDLRRWQPRRVVRS
jgi:hypothetical protein